MHISMNIKLRLILSTSNVYIDCLFTYYQSFPNFWKHQTVISNTVSSSEGSQIANMGMPSPIYQYVFDLVVSLPIRRGPGVFMNVCVSEQCFVNN